MEKASGVALANRPGNGMTVESNALVLDNGQGIPQIGNGNDVPITLESGGIFDINGNTETFDSLTMSNGVMRNGDTNGMSTLSIVYAGGVVTLDGTSNIFDFAPGASLTVNANITGAGSLEVTGLGELELSSSNAYTGATIVESGTLALTGSGSISNTANINLASSGSALDMSQNATPTLTVNSGQTLSGFGVVTGLVVSVSGGIVAPGSPTQVGTLTVTGNSGASALGGTLLLSLNRTNAQATSQLAFAGGTVTYGGILAVTNIGPALHVGDVFHLFSAGVTTFAAFSLPATDATGNTYTWNNNVANNGTITVASVTPGINPNPGPLVFGVSGTTLSLSWTTNGGWILQTNSLGLQSTNGWFPYPGSTGVTNVNIAIGQNPASVFFRLAHP
jgi:autotransporter-associated beta strand protein